MAESILDDLFGQLIRRSPQHPALLSTSGLLSWSDLDRVAGRLAEILSPIVRAGQRVAVVAPNGPALLAGLLASWRVQAVAVPLNVRWRAYELERVLRDAEPTAIVTVPSFQGYDLADLISRLRVSIPSLQRVILVDAAGAVLDEGLDGETTPADSVGPEVCALLYTSGTTGEPKGALVTHRSQIDGARAFADVLGTGREDIAVFVIPLAHAFGFTTCLAALASGARVVLVESAFSLGPVVDGVAAHHATILHGPPALFAGLEKLHAVEGLHSLRTGFVAGASCPAALLRTLDESGLPILNLYGMTEIGGACCCRPDDPPLVRYTTVGRPLPGYELRTRPQPQGEVQVSGPCVTPGYYRRPDETTAAFDAGWFRTGDLGSFDADGHLCISGRAKDVIQVAGLNVFPAEVEGLLLTHPDVVQAAVIGWPHPVMGETLRAFVVARPGSGLAPRDLLQFARARIAGYKLPYVIQMLHELPVLPTGKPDRAALVRMVKEDNHAVQR
jgi:acyl-CoA synthetase (AMP-forming)/AMP-acid ligase II